jgi:hypothetical protein
VCNWLIEHQVPHTHEPYIVGSAASKRRQKRGDFLVNGWYIEVWGIVNVPAYEARKAEKLALYHRLNIPLIELFPAAFEKDAPSGERWEDVLSRCLARPTFHQPTLPI